MQGVFLRWQGSLARELVDLEPLETPWNPLATASPPKGAANVTWAQPGTDRALFTIAAQVIIRSVCVGDLTPNQ
jgi:hypothetical protein